MVAYSFIWLSMLLSRVVVNRKTQAFTYPLLFIFLLIFSGLRWEVGCDWINYLRHFNIVSNPAFNPAEVNIEHGWWYLIDFIQAAGLPYFMVNLTVSLVFFFSIHRLAKCVEDPYSFLIVLFPMLILGVVMAAVRQAVAVGIISLSFIAFIDRSPLRMGFYILLASTFHVSSLIFTMLLPFCWGSPNKRKFIVAVLLSAPIAVLILLSENAEEASNVYVGTEVVSKGVFIRLGCLISTSMLFWLFLRGTWKENSPRDYPLAMIFFWGTVGLVVLSFVSSVVADRFSYYLVPLQALVIVRAQFLPDVKSRHILLAAQWAILSIALFGWMLVSEHFSRCYDPYANVIFK